ncbi:fumarylacetoacetate hydrolase family protein [Halococcus hamelinensis]|uniref:5-carboxymethyl-2-hydroxymuconate delta-isomerase n=1 Tax=Halococcus hamelinensis 100A6 TaxID=1132509 RepID=M0LYU5_9EURY|nr:fumarylacetoacetate hydrolase family protein [Halococcus hamelinensis]EMA38348.1 5-carboxymethyl-2-hydroxymuconate delta-isomerase [Halococcus hamelinensis 100A6]
MRIGRFGADDEPAWVGVVDGGTTYDVREAAAEIGIDLPRGTVDLLATWGWREKVELAVEYAAETGEATYDVESLDRYAPVTDPAKVVCVGLNYADHADEGGFEAPDAPVLFSKFPTALTGPEAAIEWDPALTEAVDYEGELVAVIGDRARNVAPEDALDHVAGYTVGNDVSARDLQLADEQWVRGKSLDTFGPLGPDIVTPEEIPDLGDLDVWTEVNGERLQESNTRHLVFGIDELVSFCSRAFTLEPGDVIYTGTPDGVGYFRDPQVLLEDGDSVTVGVEGVGELHNPCAHTDR